MNLSKICKNLGVCLLITSGATLFATGLADEPAVNFSVTEKTDVPGLTLMPGIYSIKVLDHLADRLIIRVDSADGKTHSTFIGLNDPQLPAGTETGQIAWPRAAGGTKALRGYTFPGGTTVEFVYPKADAVSLAKVNSSRVPAIDPASEGKVSDKNLSKDDMELVTLWMLSSTTVGPNDQPGIAAEKFKASSESAPAAQILSRPAMPRTTDSVAANAKPVAPRAPVIAKLPHTAGPIPFLLLVALFSTLGAVCLRLFGNARSKVKTIR